MYGSNLYRNITLHVVPTCIREKFTGECNKDHQPQFCEVVQPVVTMSHSYHQQCSELLAVKDTIITSLHDQIRTLNNQVESLKQGQDFRSYYAVEGTPHDMMQRRLRNILVEVQGWARMLFKSSKHGGNGNIGNKPVTNLLASGPLSVELQDVFKEICPDDTIPGALQEVKVQDAMAAVASNFVIREAVMNPLGGCTPEMKQMAESPTYKAMTRDNALTGKLNWHALERLG